MTPAEFKSLRLKLNYSQITLGKQLFKTTRQIQNYEYGKTKIPKLVEWGINQLIQQHKAICFLKSFQENNNDIG